jgi:hypothetical protein
MLTFCLNREYELVIALVVVLDAVTRSLRNQWTSRDRRIDRIAQESGKGTESR